MTRCFILLGSNIESERNLQTAVRKLAERATLLGVSPVYETEPVGTLNQPNFLNAAVLIETELSAIELKQMLRTIEHEQGRVRTSDKNAPRTIDLDIALFGDEILEVDGRQIPDPDCLKFSHIAIPLADLASQHHHPETGQTFLEIAQNLPNKQLNLRSDVNLSQSFE
jgi:2-amino-4-hydroxy-6-hydroxymethyldihydropteridine diphosphokinase